MRRIPTASQMSFFRVSLDCEAAPHIGCGTRARPVLAEVERQPGVREARLNREGTVLGVIWESEACDGGQILRSLSRHSIAGVELRNQDRLLACETFSDEGEWYPSQQLQALSAQEAKVIAARLMNRLAQNCSLAVDTSERLRAALEQACAQVLADASATLAEIRRQQIASALLGAGHDVLDPAAFASLQAVVALGHRPLPGES